MIFWIWRSYYIRWLCENKVWCPVSKKRRKYFHFLLSLAYPIDRLDWALFSVVRLFHCYWFPLLEKVEIRAFVLPRNFPAVLIIFTGRGGAGNPPPPHSAGRGGASIPDYQDTVHLDLDDMEKETSSWERETIRGELKFRSSLLCCETFFQARRTNALCIAGPTKNWERWLWR